MPRISSNNGSDIVGISPTTEGAIAVWDDTTATTLENSLTNVQSSGAIEAQGFITNREINGTVIVNSTESWITPSMELQSGSVVIVEAGGQIIII